MWGYLCSSIFQERNPHRKKSLRVGSQLRDLVSPHCCDPCRAARCRAHSVAADFCSFRDVAGAASRYTTQPSPERPFSCHPLPEVLRVDFKAKRGSRYTGASQLHCRVSRYTVPLSLGTFTVILYVYVLFSLVQEKLTSPHEGLLELQTSSALFSPTPSNCHKMPTAL